MLKLYSQLIGLPIWLVDEEKRGGRVLDIIVDPDNGKLVALLTLRGRVIAPVDIAPWRGERWEVRSAEAMIAWDDLVRLRTIPEGGRWLIHKAVLTESGGRLGRAADYVMDMDTLTLVQLYVAKKFLFLPLEKRIINRKAIVEVNERSIIVKDQQATDPAILKKYFRIKKDVQAPMPLTHIREPVKPINPTERS